MGEKKSERITKPMNVTIDADIFDKLNSGEIKSNNGLRSDDGRFRGEVTISPLTDSDLTKQKVIVKRITKTVYLHEKPNQINAVGGHEEEPFLQRFFGVVFHTIANEISREENLDSFFRGIRRFFGKKTASSDSLPEVLDVKENSRETSNNSYVDVPCTNLPSRIIATEEQEKEIREALRSKARELVGLIYLYSRLVVKSEKTNEEYEIEQGAIKELLSKETLDTMYNLIDRRALLEPDAARCLSDFLDGYVRNGKELIPVPEVIHDDEQQNDQDNATIPAASPPPSRSCGRSSG